MVDADESVRSAAHNLLERYGCVVETAHDGGEAICMVRNMALEGNYDVIIADIRLPDMTGYELLLKLQEIMDPVPMVLMTGFGYDPGHSIVKARQAGLPLYGVLYKPFRLDQLLDTVERIVTPRDATASAEMRRSHRPRAVATGGDLCNRQVESFLPRQTRLCPRNRPVTYAC